MVILEAVECCGCKAKVYLRIKQWTMKPEHKVKRTQLLVIFQKCFMRFRRYIREDADGNNGELALKSELNKGVSTLTLERSC